MENNYQLSKTESGDTFRYSELITILNPTPNIWNSTTNSDGYTIVSSLCYCCSRQN